jgi:hypothetical protein
MTDRGEAARRLLSFAQTQFGERLASLLLSGYGERQAVTRRRYAVNYREGGGQKREVQVEVVSDDPAGLPAREEPLALLALLRLQLLSRRPLGGSVPYRPREMIQTLGWDGVAGRAAVDRAIGRYYDLSFISHTAAGEAADKESANRKRVLRPIMEWGREEDAVGGGRLIVPKDGGVRFNPDFIEGLQDRSLLGIDWDGVNVITPTEGLFVERSDVIFTSDN